MKTKVSEITIIPIKPKNGLIALASCVLDEKFYLGSIGIYTRLNGGYRLTYPTKKVGIHSINIYHPISKEVGDLVEQAVIAEYEKIVETNLTENLEAPLEEVQK